MKRKIFIFFVILTLISSVCCLFVGCNEYSSTNGLNGSDSVSESDNCIDIDEELENIDGSDDPCYLRTIPLYAWDVDFEKGPFSYSLRSDYDKELIKRHKK